MEPQQITLAEKESATAKVVNIDAANRKLTVKDEEGEHLTVKVPDDIERFDQIKKGDTIKVDYYESLSLSLVKGQKGAKPSIKETTLSARETELLPAGVEAQKITATAEVTKVDPEGDTVTIKGPKNQMHTIHVTDPELQSKLDTLKKGDMIEATYTEAVVVSVERQQKKQG